LIENGVICVACGVFYCGIQFRSWQGRGEGISFWGTHRKQEERNKGLCWNLTKSAKDGFEGLGGVRVRVRYEVRVRVKLRV
jgi:hypothetical protein